MHLHSAILWEPHTKYMVSLAVTKILYAVFFHKMDRQSLCVPHLNTLRQGLSKGLEYGIGQGSHTHVIESAKESGASHVLRLVAWVRNEHTDV